MKVVKIPGFTAGRSLYKTNASYQSVAARVEGDTTQSIIGQIRGGSVGIGGSGGLNALGCWDSCCDRRCVAGHYEAGPVGWYWVCDSNICIEPCEKCLWPW